MDKAYIGIEHRVPDFNAWHNQLLIADMLAKRQHANPTNY